MKSRLDAPDEGGSVKEGDVGVDVGEEKLDEFV
jgi:hypothetical protein